ncbi:MAG: hypothetical protein JO015_05465 [Verrucomicrobia bacterium]|nr:hypothetical protein [Verrucomicrobiota bacterium]
MWRIIFVSILTVVSSTGATFGQGRLQSTMVDAKYTGKLRENMLLKFEPAAGVSPTRRLFTGSSLHYPTGPSLGGKADRGPWKFNIVTTIFWIGERAAVNNPVPNSKSSWDPEWALRYGGYDDPEPAARRDFRPVNFVPRQNPFYVALPYNDVEGGHTKLEAAAVIPWFRETFVHDGQTTLKGHWIAIRHGDRACYAQWEDCGPFRTDHWQYVFGDERPRPNLNRGAGLDVSPSVRDYLGLRDIDVCDWKFVEFRDVPSGPWAFYGDNNPFVIARRQSADRFARK